MTKKKAEQLAERRHKAFGLLRSGATYREVASVMRTLQHKETGELLYPKYSHTSATRDVKAVLAELRDERLSMAEEYVDLELQRLDIAAVAIAKKVQSGDLFAIDRWVKIIETRMRLLGLDAPVKLQVNQSVDRELEQFLDSIERALPPDTFNQVLNALTLTGDRAQKAQAN